MLGKKDDTPNKEAAPSNNTQTSAKDYKAAKEGYASTSYSNNPDFDDDVPF